MGWRKKVGSTVVYRNRVMVDGRPSLVLCLNAGGLYEYNRYWRDMPLFLFLFNFS